jgi:Tfp pilus assembly protein PilN
MIKINLFPEDLKKDESSFANFTLDFKGKEKQVINTAIAVVVILAIVHAVLFFIGQKSSLEYKALSKKNDKLLPAKQEYESLKIETNIVNKKAKAIDDLMANRFSWAKKLNNLGDAMVPGIWLTDISYEDKQVEAPSQAKTPKMITLRYLNISGYASTMGEEGTALVGKFIKSMKDDPSFFSDFSEIKLESIRSERVLEQEVMSFKITCLFKNT